MKMYEILNLSGIYESIKNEKMPIKTAYKLSKLIKTIEEEDQFYRTKFQELIEEYGEKDENGQYVLINNDTSVKIIDGKQKECSEKMNDLQNIEVKTPDIKFALEELESINMTVEMITALMPFIED